jgi:protease PrsW
MLPTDPKLILMAFLGGIVPSLLWLWFWLKEDEEHPEPKGLLAIMFIMGMLAVVLTYPVQKYIQGQFADNNTKLILWAAVEEFLKYFVVLIILLNTKKANEPIDWPIYLIAAAVGFATLENTLYLLKPLSASGTTVSLLTGHLRYLGSTLLHTVASGIIGIAIGLSFYSHVWAKKISLLSGFILAVVLHSAFNFFIIRNNGSDYMKVFAFLWVVSIVVMLAFEKVRRMYR